MSNALGVSRSSFPQRRVDCKPGASGGPRESSFRYHAVNYLVYTI
jgi:hypothetical protein